MADDAERPSKQSDGAHDANHGRWAYERYYHDKAGVGFRLTEISAAAKHLAAMIRKRCPIVGQEFPFDRCDARAQQDVGKAADALWALLDYSKSMPPKMALHINAIDYPGHPQRAAVVPLFRLWNTYHDDVAPAIAKAKVATMHGTLAEFERRTVGALESAAAELDELTALLQLGDPEPTLAAEQKADESPVSAKQEPMPRLTEREANILESLGDKILTADQISMASGYPNNSSFRSLLSQMVKRKLLLRAVGRSGYRRG